MLQIWNTTRFSTGLALMCDSSGADIVAVAVKATFTLPARGEPIHLADEQVPVLYEDEHHGEPVESSIARPVDVVPGKAGTDIGLVGSAHAPGGKPVSELTVHLAVGNLRKSLSVFGDRRWEESILTGTLQPSRPRPFVEMPIVHERAFGGKGVDAKGQTVLDFRNPVGGGFFLDKGKALGRALPNLESPDHHIAGWKDRPPVACFGFIDSWWTPRRAYAGTYDEAWRGNRFPFLPDDFDLHFFNLAEEGLVAPGFLGGGERVHLVNLSPRGNLSFDLPTLTIRLTCRRGDMEHAAKARLQTVVFEPDSDRFYMVWGGTFPAGKQPSRFKYVKVEAEGFPAAVIDETEEAEERHDS